MTPIHFTNGFFETTKTDANSVTALKISLWSTCVTFEAS